MKILVINAGSSSLKYQLIDMEKEVVLAKGICEKIGIEGNISHKTFDGKVFAENIPFPTHSEAFAELIKVLSTGDIAVIKNVNEITAVGHRVVQGAEKFSKSVLLDEEVLNAIVEVSDLAPLHNPAHVLAIKACQNVFPSSVAQVVVFDTAFHQTMPQKAYIFPIPYEYYEKYHIRRYGFHGTSHRYVSARFAEIIGKPLSELKLITCHLGNGSSVTAIDKGECVDTTMGFTPLDGIIMGTRSGGIDPSVVTYIMDKENLTPKQMDDLLNKKSGILGISCLTSDNRDLVNAAKEGNDKAKLALDIQRYQLKKYIGSFSAAMGGVDAVIFTGGIGENDRMIRKEACEGLEFMGLKFDSELNDKFTGTEHIISTEDSKVAVWIVPTNEELLIARDTRDIISK